MIKLSHSTEYIASFTEVLNILNEIKKNCHILEPSFINLVCTFSDLRLVSTLL